MLIFSTFRKIKTLLDQKQRNKIWILVAITLLSAGFEVLGVSLIVPIVTVIVNPNIITDNSIIAGVCANLGIADHRTFVLISICLLILVYIIKNVFLIFANYIQTEFVYSNRLITQQKLLHSYINKSYEFYLNNSSNDIIRTIKEDVTQAYELLLKFISLATEIAISVALILTVFFIDPQMTCIIAVLLILIIVLISKKVKPILKIKGDENRKYASQTYKWLLQAIRGIKEIKVTGKEAYFEDNFEYAGKKQVDALEKKALYDKIPRNLIEIGCVCSTLAVIAVMILFGKPMEELIPSLSAFAMAAIKLMPSSYNMVNIYNEIIYKTPSLDNLLSVINDTDSISSNKLESEHSLDINGDIVFKDIYYKYPNTDNYILNGASFNIPVNCSVGIVGKSGAGKTTSADILLGLLEPQSGQVMVNGVDVMSDYADWLSHIGYIPQTIFLMEDSIMANVAFGCEPDEKRVWEALREAQLEEFVKTLADGILTNIGEAGIRLSGGQRQRIGIARALYNNPEILVFDESTSSLDNATEAAIMESINNLHGNKTMIIIAHRLQTIQNCDIVYRVVGGKVQREK